MKYILSLDQGTTSSRSALVDSNGRIVAIEQQEFNQIFPRPGWVEHDAQEIWLTQLSTMRKVVRTAGVTVDDIIAIGITNQRETTVIWDRDGKPVANAIVWQDRRTAAYCEQLRADGHGAAIQHKTGLVIDAYFSGTKARWLLDNVDGLRERAERGELFFGTIDSWLLYKLTGHRVHATDHSNASRTMLYNIRDLDWDDDLLDLLDVPRSILPEVKPSCGPFGKLDATLLGAEIPVCGIAGDQQAALFGQQCTKAGMAKNTYGTGCFMLMNTADKIVDNDAGLLATIAWGMDGHVEYALEGSVFVAGAAVQWIRDGLGLIPTASETGSLAASVEDNGDVYFVPALSGLGTPYWDMQARGTIVGITRGTTRAHLVRATLEAIAFQTREVLDVMRKVGGIPLSELRVDGGAAVNDFLMQFQSDILGVPVVRPESTESTALGAAYLAGIAVGLWTHEDLQEKWAIERRFEPTMPREDRDRLFSRWLKAVERSRAWSEQE